MRPSFSQAQAVRHSLIDGAYINRQLRTINFVEFKPDNFAAVLKGQGQIDDYIAAFKSRSAWTYTNKLTRFTETLRPADFTVIAGAVERYRIVP